MAEEEEDQGAVEWDGKESQATLAEGILCTRMRGKVWWATSDAEEDGIETEETDTVEEPLESWIYDEDVPDPDAEDGKKGWGATELERNIEGAITKVGTMSRKVLRKITKKERSSSSPTPPSDEDPSPNPPSSMKRERGISTASAPVGGSLPSEDASFISSKDPARRESNVSAATYPDVTPSSVATPSRIIPPPNPHPRHSYIPNNSCGIHRLKSTDGLLTPHPLRTSTYPKSTTSSASHPPSPSHARFSNLPDSPVDVPRWMGIRGWVLALVLGVLTTLLTLANVVVFLVIPTNSASTKWDCEGMFGLHQKGWYYGAVSGN
ncbi:hypothetical protein BC829DRAFT_388750 [Chytridium lagenaria]|nr:hypothetical protein BC829DRAFT_388750 [Chytridium lagenaria]